MRTVPAVALVLLVAACSSSSPAASKSTSRSTASLPPGPTFEMAGQFSIVTGQTTAFQVSNGECVGDGKASAIIPGAAVKVTDVAGKVLGTGQLSDGSPIGVGTAIASCDFDWSVSGVPDGQSFYRIVIAGRPPIQVTSAQAHKFVRRGYLP